MAAKKKSAAKKSAAKKAGAKKKSAKAGKSRPAAKKVAKKVAKASKSRPAKKAAPVRKRPVAINQAPAPVVDAAAVMAVDERIAVVRANLRELVEQAASSAGAANEELLSQRIAEQEERLRDLRKQREELSGSPA